MTSKCFVVSICQPMDSDAPTLVTQSTRLVLTFGGFVPVDEVGEALLEHLDDELGRSVRVVDATHVATLLADLTKAPIEAARLEAHLCNAKSNFPLWVFFVCLGDPKPGVRKSATQIGNFLIPSTQSANKHHVSAQSPSSHFPHFQTAPCLSLAAQNSPGRGGVCCGTCRSAAGAAAAGRCCG